PRSHQVPGGPAQARPESPARRGRPPRGRAPRERGATGGMGRTGTTRPQGERREGPRPLPRRARPLPRSTTKGRTMSISLFDLFSSGTGPSSPHAVGPMRAAARFAREARTDPDIGPRIADVTADLYSSLAATGAGHGTLDAVVMGLEGADPETVDPISGRERVAEIDAGGGLRLDGRTEVSLRPSTIALHPLTILPQHPNGMIFTALDADGAELTRRAMFSVGGGFVVDEADMDRTIAEVASEEDGSAIFTTGDQLLRV